jgi:hypothetical protein
MRRVETKVNELVDELDYLKRREQRFRDTNGSLLSQPQPPQFTFLTVMIRGTESTNERVKNFSLLTLLVLMTLGTWQIFYLRGFFQKKNLID